MSGLSVSSSNSSSLVDKTLQQTKEEEQNKTELIKVETNLTNLKAVDEVKQQQQQDDDDEIDEDDLLFSSNIHTGRFLLASTAVGTLDNLIFFPFDYLKTRQQAIDVKIEPSTTTTSTATTTAKTTITATSASSKVASASSSTSASSSPLSSTFHHHHHHHHQRTMKQPSITSQVFHTLKNHGPLGLYKGFGWFAIANVPGDVLYMFAYAKFKEQFVNTEFGRKNTMIAHMAAGAAADFTSIVCAVPMDVISQRLQVQDTIKLKTNEVESTPKKLNGFQIARQIVQVEGVQGLFRGATLSLAFFMPTSAIWWGISEYCKKPSAAILGVSEKNVMAHALAGAISGVFTTFIMNPVDVVKTRVQTAPERTRVRDVAKDLFAKGGIRSFYRGILPRLAGQVPRSGFSFVIYEFVVSVSKIDDSK